MGGAERTIAAGPDLARLGLAQTDVDRLLGPRYRVLEFLGAGASAAVFKVADAVNAGQIKAAKIVRLDVPDASFDPLEALRAEFTMASRFAHPNLVRYFDLDLDPDGRLAVVTMDFVGGAPFGARVTGRDLHLTCALAGELLRGLQFLHECGFVHGDVKPSNFLVSTGEDRPAGKLLDYHLTFRPAADGAVSARGTLRYVAPEVIAGEPADRRSDLYSAGVLIYEALSGQAPFSGSAREISAQHLTAPVRMAAGCDKLAAVLARLLSKRPEGRHQSAVEAAGAISAALGQHRPPETRATLLGRVRSATLVGRDDAVRRFAAFVDQPRLSPSAPRVFAVQGKPGIGGRRLLRHCEVQAQAAGCKTLRVPSGADANGVLRPLEASLGLDPEPSGAPGGQAVAGYPVEAADVAPDPGAAALALAPLLASRLDRIAERLAHSAAARRVLVFADEVSSWSRQGLACLLFLTRSAARTDVRFCLSMMEDHAHSRPLRDAMAGWKQAGVAQEVRLEDLALADRCRLICQMLPMGTPAAVVEQLARRLGGSPGVIGATVEHLVSTGAVNVDAGGRVVVHRDFAAAVPDSIADIAPRILDGAQAEVRRTLELLATTGGEMHLETLAQAAGVSAQGLRTILARTSLAPVISLRTTDRGVLCGLQHWAMAPAVLASLPTSRRKELHDLIAQALEHVPSPAEPQAQADVLVHRLQGCNPRASVEATLALLARRTAPGAPEALVKPAELALQHAEGQDALALLEKLGDLHCERGTLSDAVPLFRKAALSPSLRADRRAALARKLALVCARAGDPDEAERWLARAYPADDRCRESSGKELVRAKLAEVVIRQCSREPERARRSAHEALQAAQAARDEGLIAAARLRLAEVCLADGAADDALEALEASHGHFRLAGDVLREAEALSLLGQARMLKGQWEQAVADLRFAARSLRDSGHLLGAAHALHRLASVHQKRCDWERAGRCYGEARSLCERLGYNRGLSPLLVNLSQVSASRGELEPAVDEAREALRIAGRDPLLRAQAMSRMARAQYMLGDLTGAHRAGLAVLEDAAAADSPTFRELGHRLIGEIETLRNNASDAEAHLRRALELSRLKGLREREAVCLGRLAELALTSQDVPAADSLAGAARRQASSLEGNPVRAVTHCVAGKVLLAQDRPKEALAELLKAEAVTSGTRVWDDWADTTLQLGKAYHRLGQPRFAAHYYGAALNTIEQVANRLGLEANRALFLSDPRRSALFRAIRAFRDDTQNQAFTESGKGPPV